MSERRPFMQVLREAAEKRADLRGKPMIDPKTGELTFLLHLHGVRGGAEPFYFNGSMPMPDRKGPQLP